MSLVPEVSLWPILQIMWYAYIYFKDATVIPAQVKAKVSLRIVPDQDLETIIRSLKDHLIQSFSKLQSQNKLDVRFSP